MLSLLRKLWSKPSHTVIGIDTRSNAVKILALSRQGEIYQVDHFAVASTINHAHTLSGTKVTATATALPNSAVISKILSLDAELDETELTDQIQIEAARHIPYPLSEAALDFTVLGLSEREPGKIDVLLIATRNAQIQAHAEILHQAKLQPKIIDVESYAIARASVLCANEWPQRGKNKIIAMIDIHSTFITITVLSDLKPIYHHQESYSLSQASEKNSLLSLIQHCLQLFFATSHFEQIDHISLTGEITNMPDLCEALTQDYTTPCTIVNPFKHMTFNPHIDINTFNTHAPSLMMCCGLALRSFSA